MLKKFSPQAPAEYARWISREKFLLDSSSPPSSPRPLSLSLSSLGRDSSAFKRTFPTSWILRSERARRETALHKSSAIISMRETPDRAWSRFRAIPAAKKDLSSQMLRELHSRPQSPTPCTIRSGAHSAGGD